MLGAARTTARISTAETQEPGARPAFMLLPAMEVLDPAGAEGRAGLGGVPPACGAPCPRIKWRSQHSYGKAGARGTDEMSPGTAFHTWLWFMWLLNRTTKDKQLPV